MRKNSKQPAMLLKWGVALAVVAGVGGNCNAAPAENQSYADFEKAVLDGKDIRMTLDLSNCAVEGTDKPGPSIRGSARLDAFMVLEDHIAFSMTHFTVRSDNSPVTEFVSFEARPTGKVEVRSRAMNAATFAVFRDAAFDCELGKGIALHW
jgi:VirK protein